MKKGARRSGAVLLVAGVGIVFALFRIIWLILIFVPPGIGLVGYLLAWLVMPKEQPTPVTMALPFEVPQ